LPPGTPKPAGKTYNDEIPVPPYEDPRTVRARAIQLEKEGKGAEAKVMHIKADTLNTMIKAQKLKGAGQAALGAIKSLLK